METTYFDTFVYNQLIDNRDLQKRILTLRNSSRIEIIFSEYLFNELVCTWDSLDGEKQKRITELFKCVIELITDKILKQGETIVDEEIRAFLSISEQQNIFFEKQQKQEIILVMQKLAKGEAITNTKPIAEVAKDKKTTHGKYREIIGKYRIGLQEAKSTKDYPSFEEFYVSSKIREEEFIDDLLRNKIIQNSDPTLIMRVKENADNLPYFKSYLRLLSAYQYSFFVYKKPSRGDDYDLRHFTCASNADILVADVDFIDIVKWAYPKKKCFTLDDFCKYFKINI